MKERADIQIPSSLRDAIYFLKGEEEGDRWLAALPGVWSAYSERWGLEPESVLEGGAMSCCLLCSVNGVGDSVVLKIPAESAAGVMEAAALSVWSESSASPAVLQSDSETGVYAMEYIAPGDTSPKDPLAMADLLNRLQRARASSSAFEPLSTNVEMRLDWARDRFGVSKYESERWLLPKVNKLASDLLDTGSPAGLVHGDLQTKNVLSDLDGQLVVIDPLACVGDIHYDAAMWVVTQANTLGIRELIRRLADAWDGCDEGRVIRWASVLAVLEFRPYQEDRRDRFAEFIFEAWGFESSHWSAVSST